MSTAKSFQDLRWQFWSKFSKKSSSMKVKIRINGKKWEEEKSAEDLSIAPFRQPTFVFHIWLLTCDAALSRNVIEEEENRANNRIINSSAELKSLFEHFSLLLMQPPPTIVTLEDYSLKIFSDVDFSIFLFSETNLIEDIWNGSLVRFLSSPNCRLMVPRHTNSSNMNVENQKLSQSPIAGNPKSFFLYSYSPRAHVAPTRFYRHRLLLLLLLSPHELKRRKNDCKSVRVGSCFYFARPKKNV